MIFKQVQGNKAKKGILIEVIESEIRNNSNYLMVIDGKPGVGKSWAALKIAQSLDPNFTAKNVFFTLEEFLKNVNDDHPKGTVFVFDEAGVEYDNQLWQKKQSIMANHVMQTFRWKNYIVIFTTPDIGFTNKKATILYHGLLHLERRFSKQKVVWGKFYNLGTRFGKQTTTFTKVVNNDGTESMRAASSIYIFQPSKTLVDEYEKKMADYKNAVAKNAYEEIVKLSNEPKKKEKRLSEGLKFKMNVEEVKNNMNNYRDQNGKLDWSLVTYKMGMSPQKAKEVVRTVNAIT